MRIFAAGLFTETNTFSPVPTCLEDYTIHRGKDVESGQGEQPMFDLSKIWGEPVRAQGHTFAFSLMACAQPAGATVRSAYESLRDEILDDLRSALPVDVVLLMLHGAMVAEGYDDCEEDIIRRVRDVVGPGAVIGVELDLHCHLSESMIAPADIVVTYKEYPHTDINDRAREVLDLAIASKTGRIRPTKALFDCRMIGMYPTSPQPMRGFVDAMKEAEQRKGVLSISFGHGYQFADLPHVGAKMLVVTDSDLTLADQVAREFGLRVYELRSAIGFDSLSLPIDTALSRAIRSNKTPVVVADQSDNVGGGAPGDATFALRWLLDHQATDVALAIVHDPEVVKIARKAGIGTRLQVRLGGKTGPASGQPVDLEVTVLSTVDQYTYRYSQQAGASLPFPLGDVAALRCGSIDIVVASKRCQCYSRSIFEDLGIDPTRKQVLIPKSAQHFYSSFAPIAGEVIYMNAPGAATPDPKLVPYRRLLTDKMYPWNQNPLGR